MRDMFRYCPRLHEFFGETTRYHCGVTSNQQHSSPNFRVRKRNTTISFLVVSSCFLVLDRLFRTKARHQRTRVVLCFRLHGPISTTGRSTSEWENASLQSATVSWRCWKRNAGNVRILRPSRVPSYRLPTVATSSGKGMLNGMRAARVCGFRSRGCLPCSSELF